MVVSGGMLRLARSIMCDKFSRLTIWISLSAPFMFHVEHYPMFSPGVYL